MSATKEVELQISEMSVAAMVAAIEDLTSQLPSLLADDPERIVLSVAVKDGPTLDEPTFFYAAIEYDDTRESVAKFLSAVTAIYADRLEPARFDEDLEFGAAAAIGLAAADHKYLASYASFLSTVDFDHAHFHIQIVESLSQKYGQAMIAGIIGPVLIDAETEAELFTDAMPWLTAGGEGLAKLLGAFSGQDSKARDVALADLASYSAEEIGSQEIEAVCQVARDAVAASPPASAAAVRGLVTFVSQDQSFLRSNAQYYLWPAFLVAAARNLEELEGLLRYSEERGVDVATIAAALLLAVERAHATGCAPEVIAALREHAHRRDERDEDTLLRSEAGRVLDDTICGDAICRPALPSLLSLLEKIAPLEVTDAFKCKRIMDGFMYLCRQDDGALLASGIRIAATLRFTGESLAPPSYLAVNPGHFFGFLTSNTPATAHDLIEGLRKHLAAHSGEDWNETALNEAAALIG